MRPKNLEKEQAIRTVALQMIAEDGLENLSMQKLAKASNISPRTIYIKYENKEDLLVKLFIEEVLDPYEQAALADFNPTMDFAEGVRKMWMNAFNYFKKNRHAYLLLQYGRSSPLMNKAYQEKNIKQGDYFGPVVLFIKNHVKRGTIRNLPFEAQRALMLPPLLDLVNEYFEQKDRAKKIITEKVISDCCEAVIKGMLK